MDRGGVARDRRDGRHRPHHPGPEPARGAVMAAARAQRLFGRECRLARWPRAAARYRQHFCASRRPRPRTGSRHGGRVRAVGVGGNARRGCRRREPAAGNDGSADGPGIPAEVTMSLDLRALTRRELLLGSGVLFAWASMPRIAHAEGRDPRLLVIALRGALDGLGVVAPIGDPDWGKLRGDKGLALEGTTPALPLDGFFALNPAMPNFHRMYQAGQATIVHAVATPYRERSHFDGQDVLESGLAKPGAADTGWLNRTLAA